MSQFKQVISVGLAAAVTAASGAMAHKFAPGFEPIAVALAGAVAHWLDVWGKV